MDDVNAWNQTIIAEFRASEGRVGGQFAGQGYCCCTRGARGVGNRVLIRWPTLPMGERYVVIALEGGALTNADWYYNVVAHQRVTVEEGPSLH